MKAGEKLGFVVCALVLCLFMVSSANGGIVSVRNITFTVPAVNYYYGNSTDGYFTISASASGKLQTYGVPETEYNYDLKDVTLSFTQCDLVDDASSGGLAKAILEGGATLTVSATLTEAGQTDVLYSGNILVADMVLSSMDTWELIETSAVSSTVSANLDMLASDGGLATGIVIGADSFMIGDMVLKLAFTTAGISDFNSNKMAMLPSIQIYAEEIPEPASILLLAGGWAFLYRRKR